MYVFQLTQMAETPEALFRRGNRARTPSKHAPTPAGSQPSTPARKRKRKSDKTPGSAPARPQKPAKPTEATSLVFLGLLPGTDDRKALRTELEAQGHTVVERRTTTSQVPHVVFGKEGHTKEASVTWWREEHKVTVVRESYWTNGKHHASSGWPSIPPEYEVKGVTSKENQEASRLAQKKEAKSAKKKDDADIVVVGKARQDKHTGTDRQTD